MQDLQINVSVDVDQRHYIQFNEAYKGFIQRFLKESISVSEDYKELKIINSKTKSIDKIVVGKEDSNFLC